MPVSSMTPPHLAPERVDLPHDLPLGDSADGRVAAHLADRVEVHRHERGLGPHAGRRQRRLAPRVARSDHHDIEIVIGRIHSQVSGPHLYEDQAEQGSLAARQSTRARLAGTLVSSWESAKGEGVWATGSDVRLT